MTYTDNFRMNRYMEQVKTLLFEMVVELHAHAPSERRREIIERLAEKVKALPTTLDVD